MPFQNLRRSFSSISLISFTQLATIQPKNLTKTKKNIHNSDCILAKKKKNYFTTKKLCVIREGKTKFFATKVNQLTVANC